MTVWVVDIRRIIPLTVVGWVLRLLLEFRLVPSLNRLLLGCFVVPRSPLPVLTATTLTSSAWCRLVLTFGGDVRVGCWK